ncbi:ABC transporter, ATP-binding protein [human gut metagenome]|uniref:ABC transporter, ATP-binding protein n=1 Tax=human gut metagenome TaxID=408170 RepID=K1UZ04_9ZZZZ
MFSKKVGPKYVVLREKLSRLNTKAQENIAANRVVKAFAREEYEKEDFDKYNRDYCEYNQQAAMVWLTFQPYIETLAQALWAVQMLVGGIFVINGRITIAQYTVSQDCYGQ